MKTKILLPIVVMAALAALIFGYTQMSKERSADEEADQPVTATSRVQAGANGETVFALDAKTQKLIGLQTATLAATTLSPEIQAYGRVLDSTALVSLQNDALAARAAAQASQAEYERRKKLNAQNNASAHALETAEAQMKHDQSALATAEAQLTAAAGATVASQAAEFFQSLARQESVLVRLDLPAGEISAEDPKTARLIVPGMQPPVIANFLCRAATIDPQVQGAGFIFVATNAPPTLAPGLALAGFLQLPGGPRRGVIVPDNAVVRSDGRAWIYLQTGETNFVQREISLDRATAGGWFATNNVAPGDKIVITGAQMLLSEAHKSEIQIGD